MTKSIYLTLLLLFSAGMASVEIITGLKGYETEAKTQILWSLTFIVLTIFWLKEDAKINKFDIPFDMDFLLYLLWPITLPWYLISTRGADGIILFIGFLFLYIGPWLSGLVAYAYFG